MGKRISFSISEEEHEEWSKAAAPAYLNHWIRTTCSEAATGQRKPLVPIPAAAYDSELDATLEEGLAVLAETVEAQNGDSERALRVVARLPGALRSVLELLQLQRKERQRLHEELGILKALVDLQSRD